MVAVESCRGEVGDGRAGEGEVVRQYGCNVMPSAKAGDVNRCLNK